MLTVFLVSSKNIFFRKKQFYLKTRKLQFGLVFVLYNNIISGTDIYIMYRVLTPVHPISLKLDFKIKIYLKNRKLQF